MRDVVNALSPSRAAILSVDAPGLLDVLSGTALGVPEARQRKDRAIFSILISATRTKKLRTNNQKTALLARRSGCSADVHVAQLSQSRLILFAHPRVKFGSFRCWLRADSGIFFSTPSRCEMDLCRSGGNCFHLGITSFRM